MTKIILKNKIRRLKIEQQSVQFKMTTTIQNLKLGKIGYAEFVTAYHFLKGRNAMIFDRIKIYESIIRMNHADFAKAI